MDTTIVVDILVENLELKTCVDEGSLLPKGADSFLAENSAHVCSASVIDDKVDSLD